MIEICFCGEEKNHGTSQNVNAFVLWFAVCGWGVGQIQMSIRYQTTGEHVL